MDDDSIRMTVRNRTNPLAFSNLCFCVAPRNKSACLHVLILLFAALVGLAALGLFATGLERSGKLRFSEWAFGAVCLALVGLGIVALIYMSRVMP